MEVLYDYEDTIHVWKDKAVIGNSSLCGILLAL